MICTYAQALFLTAAAEGLSLPLDVTSPVTASAGQLAAKSNSVSF